MDSRTLTVAQGRLDKIPETDLQKCSCSCSCSFQKKRSLPSRYNTSSPLSSCMVTMLGQRGQQLPGAHCGTLPSQEQPRCNGTCWPPPPPATTSASPAQAEGAARSCQRSSYKSGTLQLRLGITSSLPPKRDTIDFDYYFILVA